MFTSPFALFLPFSYLHTLSSANIISSIEKIKVYTVYTQLIIIQVFSGKVRMTTKNSWEKRSQDSYCFALKIFVLLMIIVKMTIKVLVVMMLWLDYTFSWTDSHPTFAR